jgi:hypothetical protein
LLVLLVLFLLIVLVGGFIRASDGVVSVRGGSHEAEAQ